MFSSVKKKSLSTQEERQDREKQDDSKATVIMTCGVWLVMGSVVCAFF